MSNRQIVGYIAIALGVAVFIITLAVVTTSGGHYSDAANRACVGHRGVRQLDDNSNSAVCWDGYVGHVNY